MKGKPIVLLSVALAVLTIYLTSQLWAPVTNDRYNRDYSREIISQIHLNQINLIMDSDATSEGFFVSNLTFENPTSEKLTLSSFHAEYYYMNSTSGGGWKIAVGWSSVVFEMPPGNSTLALRMDLEPYSRQNPDLIVEGNQWWIYYRPKLEYVSCQMTALATDSEIRHEGPTYLSDEIYSVINTYVVSIVGSWIFGLEIVAVFLIKTRAVPSDRKHNTMLFVIYALQGLGIIVAQVYISILYALVPLPPVEFPYGSHGVATGALGFLLIEIDLTALAFLFVALGLFIRRSWAGRIAMFMSAASIGVFVYVIAMMLRFLADQGALVFQNIALIALFSLVAFAHGLVVYLLATGRVVLRAETPSNPPPV